MLKPELFTTFKTYTKDKFLSDLSAGVIVGIVAIPLAIAFAIASGVSPDKGLITAVIAGFIISAIGGSKVQIGGPTGAFVVIVYGIIQQYGIDGLIISTVMAGIILTLMGLFKFGSVIKFIPYPVIVGFTSGIAVIIFLSQIKDFFGLSMGAVPSEFFEKITAFSANMGSLNPIATAIAVGSLLLIIGWSFFKIKIPGSFAAIILATIIVTAMGLPVETIGSRFGEIPNSLPAPVVPSINIHTIKNLFQPALTIALLGAIESLLSAIVADGIIGGKHKSNMELVAQGVANIVVPFFGGIPATGAIARTITNIKSGGKTPVAGIIHAIFLLLTMMFFGQYVKLIPLCVLAAILVSVSYNMFEWHEFKNLRKCPKSDAAVLLATFVLTVVFDLTVAIEMGMVLAVLLFIRRMALVSNVGVVTRELTDTEEIPDDMAIAIKEVPEGVDVYEINGPFFFGAAGKFREQVDRIQKLPIVRIIRMRMVPAIDQTGIHFIEEFYTESIEKGVKVVFSGMHAQPYRALDQAGFLAKVAPEDICPNIDMSLERAKQIVAEHKAQNHRA